MPPRNRRPARPAAARGGDARPPRADHGISPERIVAHRVLRRVADGAYADRALSAEARRAHLDPRQRSAAMRLAYGAVQRRRTLDWMIDGALERPDRLEPELREVLRLGAYELAFSDRVPASAAVDQAVRLARTLHGAPSRRSARAGLVNAVMRRLSTDAPGLLEDLARPGVPMALRHSVPDWIADGLVASLGEEDADGVLAAANLPAESALRWNPLRGPRRTVEDAVAGAGWHGDPLLPEALVLEGPFALEDDAVWAAGRALGQSRASMLPARAVAPKPGEVIVDMCAAPGAKATHLAALARNGARVICVELHPARARALRDLARRLGARVEVVEGDARSVPLPDGVDGVLLDPPCTGLGVLSARPDARWRRREESLEALSGLQRELLARAAGLVRPGGRVVYSTCTLLAAENEDVVRGAGLALDDLSAEFPGLGHPRLPGALLTLPHRHGMDGFFVARLRRD